MNGLNGSAKNGAPRRRSRFYFFLFTFMSYLLIIYTFYFYMVERGTAAALLFPIIGVLIVVIALILLKRASKTEAEMASKARRYEEILSGITHTYSVVSARKEIDILNADGDASVKTSFVCRNASNTLDKVQIQISHDGSLEERNIKCNFDDHPANPSDIKMHKIVDLATNKPVGLMPYRLIFNIKPSNPVQPRQTFSYGYEYKCKGLYPKITKKGEEGTVIEILHPNERLAILVSAPEGYEFDDKIVTSVYDRDGIEHLNEMKRLELSNLPFLSRDKKRLIWEVSEPRIADHYKLFFSIHDEKEQHTP